MEVIFVTPPLLAYLGEFFSFSDERSRKRS